MRFSVDPWDPSYGVNVDLDEGGDAKFRVDPAVEVPPQRWEPVDPPPGAMPPAATLFVDGVRRVDAQAWIHDPDGGDAAPGLYASSAAGVVCCCRDGAHLAAHRVRRDLLTSAAHAVDVRTGCGSYAATTVQVRPNKPPGQELSLALQGLLNRVEAEVAADARAQLSLDDDLLVVDGPLKGRQNLPRAVGYVKTHHRAYLRKEENAVVAALAPGQRTPVFRLVTSWERFTWYLRLPCVPGAPWAGVVRLECGAHLDPGEAVALAARSQVTLGRYASAGYKDARAPQNLYPIAGLERQLRRRLGDAGVLYRALRTAAGRPGDTAAGRPGDTAAGRPGDTAAGRPVEPRSGASRPFDPAVSGLAG
jgi:hypothetical protein